MPSTTPKTTKTKAKTTKKAPKIVVGEDETPVVTEKKTGVRNLVKAQKIAIDAVVAQTDRTAEYVKTRYGIDETRRSNSVISATKDGVERVATFQKDMLDKATDRIESTLENRKAKVEVVVEPKAARLPLRGLAKNGITMMLDGQEELVNLGQKQGKLMLEGLEQLSRFRVGGFTKSLAQFSGKALRNVVDSQERMLEINAGYVQANRQLIKNSEDVEGEDGFTKFAYEGVDAALEASGKILDVVQDQNRATRDRIAVAEGEASAEERATNEWFGLAREGVERIGRGQKASVDFSREVVERVFAG